MNANYFLEIRNVRLYGRELTTISIKGNRILSLGTTHDWHNVIDGQGLTAIPGLIDMHTHDRLGEPESETLECFAQAAIRGGVTTVGCMPNNPTGFTVTTEDALHYKGQRLRCLPISSRIFFGATPGNGRDFSTIAGHPLLAGVKLYMVSTTGTLLVQERSDQLAVCRRAADSNLIVVSHVGVEAKVRENRSRLARPTVADHCIIRPPALELEGGLIFLDLLRESGAQGHLAHVTLPELLAAALHARSEGVRVTCEVCPHHVRFTDKQLAREDGALFKTNPCLRSPDHVRGLQQDLFNGRVDSVATDHAPHDRRKKKGQDYDSVASGMPGLQEMLPTLMGFVHSGKLTLDQLIEVTARRPARIFRWPRKGEIAAGFDADIVLLDPQEESVFTVAEIASKCGWSAYVGQPMYGKPRLVVANGRVVLNRLLLQPA